MISDGLGSTAQAGSDRSDGTLASGDVPGEDRRLRWPGAEGRVGKDHSSDVHAISFIRYCRTVCRRHTVAASTSRINKGMISKGVPTRLL